MSLLDGFFKAQFDNGFTCTDITTLFDHADGQTGGTRVNTIFAQLASLTNPDFLGISGSLNLFKGSLWNDGLAGSQSTLECKNPLACINALSNLAVIFAIFNNQKLVELFSSTNARIYSAFKGIDVLITNENECSNPPKDSNNEPFKATWADAYSKYITDKIASNNDLITKAATIVSQSIPTDPANPAKGKYAAGNIRKWSTFMTSFNDQYDVAHFTFPQPNNWPNNALPIQKRADPTGKSGACKLPQSSSVATENPSAGETTVSAELSSAASPSPTLTSPVVLTSNSAPSGPASFTCTKSE